MNRDEKDESENIPKVIQIFIRHLPFAQNVYDDHLVHQFDETLPYVFLPDVIRAAHKVYDDAVRNGNTDEANDVITNIALAVEEALDLHSPYVENLIVAGFCESVHEFLDTEKLISSLGPKGKKAYAESYN